MELKLIYGVLMLLVLPSTVESGKISHNSGKRKTLLFDLFKEQFELDAIEKWEGLIGGEK